MAVSYSDFTTARDFFEAVRVAAGDADSLTRRLSVMESREGVRAQTYEVHGHGGGGADAMRRTDERMDFEALVRRRRQEDYDLIDMACDVIYGEQDQMTGGVCALLGPHYADVLWWRFCGDATWPEVAQGAGMSERWCRDSVAVSMDTIDSYGLERVATGLGLACE